MSPEGDKRKRSLLGDIEEVARQLREAQAETRRARARLARVVRAARDEGIPFAVIGRRANLSREGVRKLYQYHH